MASESENRVLIQQAVCWAYVRRHFYDLEQVHASPIEQEALLRIVALYKVEDQIRGKPAGGTPRRAPGRVEAIAGLSAAVVGDNLIETLAQVGREYKRTSSVLVAAENSEPHKPG
jgi:uncharacterized Fe-S cluster-containing radical SAM superfamily protein